MHVQCSLCCADFTTEDIMGCEDNLKTKLNMSIWTTEFEILLSKLIFFK